MLSAERSLKSINCAFNDKPDPGPSRYQVLYNPTTQQLVSENVTSIMNLRFGLYGDYSILLRASQPFLGARVTQRVFQFKSVPPMPFHY